MKLFVSSNLLRNSIFFKISAFVLISVACFFLGKHWSEDGFRRLIFFSAEPSRSPIVALSPDFGKTYNISDLIYQSHPVLPPSLSPPPPPDSVELKVFGIVNENGTMSDEFQIGDYDAESAETLGNQTEYETSDGDTTSTTARVSLRQFEICSENMTEYIPCLDNVEAIKRLNSTSRGERFERNCPKEGMGLNCTVPIPNGYRSPIPWPRSRDEVSVKLSLMILFLVDFVLSKESSDFDLQVWFNNVPHTRLVEDKGGQNWIYKENDKFKFPGGGTQFIHGADQYLDQISQVNRFL